MSKGPKSLRADDGVYRVRWGALVCISGHWVGGHTTPKTIRQRSSKLARRGRPKPAERMKVTREDDVDNHLRFASKRRAQRDTVNVVKRVRVPV